MPSLHMSLFRTAPESNELLEIAFHPYISPGMEDKSRSQIGSWWLDRHLQTSTGCKIQISFANIALIGGNFGSGPSRKIYIYNWVRKQWKEGPSLSK